MWALLSLEALQSTLAISKAVYSDEGTYHMLAESKDAEGNIYKVQHEFRIQVIGTYTEKENRI